MKVLTIKEPFATLIKNKVKYIETRSWKTNYRGELYIHAGLSKLTKEIKERKELTKLYKENELKYGCIYMTEDFIKEEKRKNPKNFVSGRYEVGRYAWVLDNIEPIKPIQAKGKLGIWYYNK